MRNTPVARHALFHRTYKQVALIRLAASKLNHRSHLPRFQVSVKMDKPYFVEAILYPHDMSYRNDRQLTA